MASDRCFNINHENVNDGKAVVLPHELLIRSTNVYFEDATEKGQSHTVASLKELQSNIGPYLPLIKLHDSSSQHADMWEDKMR